MKDTQNFTKSALGSEAFSLAGNPANILANYLEQVNLSRLHRDSRGRISIDPGYNIIYYSIDSGEDMRERTKEYVLPVFRLACVHGDARGDDFHSSDWAGIISIQTIIRWRYLFVVTGLTTTIQMLMPALLAVCTVIIVLKSLVEERKPLMQAASLGRPLRDQI